MTPQQHLLAIKASNLTGVPFEALAGPRRHKSLVRARWQGYKVFRDAGLSLPEIGRCFGGRDHTTILHGLRELEKQQ